MKINQTLYNKLKKHFKYNNHKKYYKYFDVWITNVTYEQLYNYDSKLWIEKEYY
jgi:hypothetical protein